MLKWTWKDEVYEVLSQLGGRAYLKEIYELVAKRNMVNITSFKNMSASIRDSIQRYSSDSDKFLGKDDLFYLVNGKGGGYWGIRNNFTNIIPSLTDDIIIHKEGFRETVLVNRYERNHKARQLCIEHFGCVCSICNLDFESMYGELGSGFIHVHHIVPLHEIGETYEVNPVSDLIPVCPNCHAMLHRKVNNIHLTPNQLKLLIK